MPFFDSHTHVQFAAFASDSRETIARALKAGVWLINVGTQIDTSRRAVEVAREYSEGVYATVGLHPIHTSKSFHDAQELGLPAQAGDTPDAKGFTSRGEDFDYDAYKELAADPKVVAIGECGLDYYRGAQNVERGAQDKQKNAFLAQIQLAWDVKKPLMIHCRAAFPDLIDTLHASRSTLCDPPGVIHFFTGTPEDARKLLEMGFAFTFGGAITFLPKAGQPRAGAYEEVIRMLPLDEILSETDAPYVAPVPYRGKRNEPAYVVEVVKKLAELKGVPVEKMAETTFNNAKRIFNI